MRCYIKNSILVMFSITSYLFCENIIYVVGDNKNHQATLWKLSQTGDILHETTLSQNTSYACDLAVSGSGDFYIVGADNGPIIWKYNQTGITSLQLTGMGDSAQAIKLLEGDSPKCIAVGFDSLWKIKLDLSQCERTLLPHTSDSKGAFDLAIDPLSKKIYIAGENEFSGSSLWVNHFNDTEFYFLPNSGGLSSGGRIGDYAYNPYITAICYGIGISGNKVYITGTKGGENPGPVVWSADQDGSFTLTDLTFLNEESQGVACSIAKGDSDQLYVIGNSFLGKTNLWKLNNDTITDQILIPHVGFMNDVTVMDNYIYAVGQTRKKGGYYGNGYGIYGKNFSRFGLVEYSYSSYGILKVKNGPYTPSLESPLVVYDQIEKKFQIYSIDGAGNLNAILIRKE